MTTLGSQDDPSSSGPDDPLVPPPPPPLPWEVVLLFALPHLRQQSDRYAVRLVCHEWRTAADATWQAACLCLAPQDTATAAAQARRLFSPGAFPLPHLQELCLAELHSSQQLQALLRQLSAAAAAMPVLRRLRLSAALGCRLSDGGTLAALHLPQLRFLALEDVEVQGALASCTHLGHLTELALSLSDPDGAGLARTAAGVCHLAALADLQALSLPGLVDGEREMLSSLTSLTRLSFTAAGKGAVGPSLIHLARLQHLTIRLDHVREHFIVLHPRVEWGALRALRTLRTLRVAHLAAYSFFPAPEVTWSDEAPVAAEVDALLATLPGIAEVCIRLSYCHLAEEQATAEAEPHIQTIPCSPPTPDHPADGECVGKHSQHGVQRAQREPRTFLRTIERVPVRQPGRRRADAWYEQWWQPAVREQQERLAAPAAREEVSFAAAPAADTRGPPQREHAAHAVVGHAANAAPDAAAGADLAASAAAAAALERWMAHTSEMAGWAAIRPGAFKTFDTLVQYHLTGTA